jgi:hypothetical protein
MLRKAEFLAFLFALFTGKPVFALCFLCAACVAYAHSLAGFPLRVKNVVPLLEWPQPARVSVDQRRFARPLRRAINLLTRLNLLEVGTSESQTY